MESWNARHAMKSLYTARAGGFAIIDVPELNYLMIDGAGDPNTSPVYVSAVQTLYTVAYGVRTIAKRELSLVHTVGPLEGLWYAEDLQAFASGNREDWQWTMMIIQPEWVEPAMVASAIESSRTKPDVEPERVRFERYDEGLAVQILHIGPYREEAPTIARMHHEFFPQNQLAPTGKHHEIYLSDPRKSAPAKLKTILRQPVRRLQ